MKTLSIDQRVADLCNALNRAQRKSAFFMAERFVVRVSGQWAVIAEMPSAPPHDGEIVYRVMAPEKIEKLRFNDGGWEREVASAGEEPR
jgi:hypothetical protein